MIVPIGVLMRMVSSIFGLFIIRSGVHLSLASLGRGFGKSRFLKGGFLFVDRSPWSDTYLG